MVEINQNIKLRLINENILNISTNNSSSQSFHTILNSDDIDFYLEELDKNILTAHKIYCPSLTKRRTIKDHKKPFITSRIEPLIKKSPKLLLPI